MKLANLRFFTPQVCKNVISFAFAILLFMGVYAIAFSLEKYNTVQAQGNNTTATPPPMNATQVNATSPNATKPVDGYGGPPTGPLTAVRHVFDDPTLRVYINNFFSTLI